MLFILLMGSSSTFGEIGLHAFWADGPSGLIYDAPLEKPVKIYVVVQLKNLGKFEETVLCKKTDPHYVFNQNGNLSIDGAIVYRVSYDAALGGGVIIPSISEMLPVRLGPGELTEFRFIVVLAKGVTPEKMRFHYQVDPDIAGRFSGWSGDISAMIHRQSK